MFKNMSLGKKISLAFGSIIVLLLLTAYVGYHNAEESENGFTQYREMARDANLVGELQADMLMVRMNVKDFVLTANPKDEEEYKHYHDQMTELLAKAKEEIQNPERAAKIAAIAKGVVEYDEAFVRVVEKQENRNRFVNEVLDVKGPLLENTLSQILESADADGDIKAAYNAGVTLRHLMLARLYATKFLDTNDRSAVGRVHKEFDMMREQTSILDAELQNSKRRDLLKSVISVAAEYRSAFDGLVENIESRNDLVEGTLNMIGPDIAKLAEEVKHHIQGVQDELGPQMVDALEMSRTQLLTIGALAFGLGVVLAFFVTRSTVRPILHLVDKANEIAKGDLNQEINIVQNDEIGKLAAAFGSMTRTLKQKAEVAEQIARGNLDIDVEAISEVDTLGKSMTMMKDSILGLMRETQQIIKAVEDGKLNQRGDKDSFDGSWAELIGGLNNIIESFVTPFEMAADTIEQISQGNIPDRIQDEYRGDFNKIKNNFNASIDIMNALLSEMQELIHAAKGGKLDTRGDASKFQGSWREMTSGVNDILDAVIAPVQEAATVLGSLADGNLCDTMTGDYKGDHASIKNALNNTIGSLNDILGQVSLAVEQVSSGSQQVSSSSQSLSEGATKQASSLEETTSSVTELGAQTKQNADNATQANQLAAKAHDAAEQGNKQMKQMLKSMDEINDASGDISKIIKVIDEIAFQTNLLALNAAVEAARAGVHGKGFAVVAEEVRNLAQRSAKAAKETTDLIEGSVKKVEDGTGIANKTAKALNEIVDGVTKVTDLVGEIASASNEQAQGIEQTNQALQEIDSVTQSNTANAEQSAAAAEELSSQASQLKQTLSKFQLNNQNVGRAVQPSGVSKVEVVEDHWGTPEPPPQDFIALDDDDGYGSF